MSSLPSSPMVVLPWLADLTLLATLWLGLLWLGMRCLPRLSAARRHLLLSAGLACLPVLMLGALRVPTWSLPVVMRMEAEVFPVVKGAHPIASAPALPAPTLTEPAAQTGVQRRQDGLALLWLVGMGVGLTALLAAGLRLRRLRRDSAVINDGRVQACWRQACAEAGVPETIAALIQHPGCVVPMTWGLRRPVVLLPVDAAQWSDERLLLVLRHELAHLTRHDVLVAAVTGLMALPLWFHPLVWLIWLDAHETREAACDDAALTRSGDRPDMFATQLLDAVVTFGNGTQWRLMPMALCMAARSAAALKRRLISILDEGRSRGIWPRWQAGGIMLVLTLGALTVSGLSACRKRELGAPEVIISSTVISVPVESKACRILAAAFEGITTRGLQVRGILDEKQAQELLRKLDEPGDDARILSTPIVTTRSGQKATVEVGRDFIHPTQFDPPVYDRDKLVTPATPTVFESQQVGVRLDFVPQAVQDGLIDLAVTSAVTRFLGFVDYGSPFRSEVIGPDGSVVETFLPRNPIGQPLFAPMKSTLTVSIHDGQGLLISDLAGVKQALFHTMKCQVSVTITDGQYLVIGGLAEEEGKSLNPEKPDSTKVAPVTEGKLNRLICFIIQPRIQNRDGEALIDSAKPARRK